MIHLTEANIGRGKATTRRLGVLHVTGRTTGATISTWCELDKDERAWATADRPDATWIGDHTLCPIQVGNRWNVVGSRVTGIYAGRPKYSPPLHLVEVTVRRKWRPLSRPVHFISTHFVADFGNHHEEYLREQDNEWGELRGAVADAHGRGLNVIVSGDFNVRGFDPLPSVHSRAVSVYRSGLDAVIAIPASGRRVVGTGTRFPLGIEPQHKGLDVRISFPRA